MNKMHVFQSFCLEKKGMGCKPSENCFQQNRTCCVRIWAQHSTWLSATLENVRETRLAERDGLLLLKSPSTACKTKEADLVTAIVPVTLLWLCPINAAVSSSFGHKCNEARGQHRHRAGTGTSPLAYTPLQQNMSSTGVFTGVSGGSEP